MCDELSRMSTSRSNCATKRRAQLSSDKSIASPHSNRKNRKLMSSSLVACGSKVQTWSPQHFRHRIQKSLPRRQYRCRRCCHTLRDKPSTGGRLHTKRVAQVLLELWVNLCMHISMRRAYASILFQNLRLSTNRN